MGGASRKFPINLSFLPLPNKPQLAKCWPRPFSLKPRPPPWPLSQQGCRERSPDSLGWERVTELLCRGTSRAGGQPGLLTSALLPV